MGEKQGGQRADVREHLLRHVPSLCPEDGLRGRPPGPECRSVRGSEGTGEEWPQGPAAESPGPGSAVRPQGPGSPRSRPGGRREPDDLGRLPFPFPGFPLLPGTESAIGDNTLYFNRHFHVFGGLCKPDLIKAPHARPPKRCLAAGWDTGQRD